MSRFDTQLRLYQAQALFLPPIFVTLGYNIFVMAKFHFRPCIPNQTFLFPPRIDEHIPKNDLARIVKAIVDSPKLDNFKKRYKKIGCCPYHLKMMLKIIIYTYMNNIYFVCKIEKFLLACRL